jgi:hypothetical protein
MNIKVVYQRWFSGSGQWQVKIDFGSYTLTRPLDLFMHDKSWNGLE